MLFEELIVAQPFKFQNFMGPEGLMFELGMGLCLVPDESDSLAQKWQQTVSFSSLRGPDNCYMFRI